MGNCIPKQQESAPYHPIAVLPIQWTHAAFSGGASNGIVYVGAYRALFESHIVATLKGAVGCSIGALFALMTVLVISPVELEHEIMALDIKKLADDSWCPIIDIERVMQQWGLCSGDFLERWVETLLEKYCGQINVTFAQLNAQTGRHLKVVVFNETHCRTEYWDHVSTPDVVVSRGIRASASMPIIYEPVRINDCLYVDGGVGDIFPLDAFKNSNTLGIMIMSRDNVRNDAVVESIRVTSISDHVIAVYTGFTITQFRLQHAGTNWAARSIALSGPNKPQWDFSFSQTEKQGCINKSYEDTVANLQFYSKNGAFPVDEKK